MHRTFLALLGVAALVCAGCGDDKKDSDKKPADTDDAAPTATQPPLTKAQFIAKADVICRENKRATKKYDDRVDALDDDDYKGFGEVLDDGLPELRKGVERLKALPAPTEDKATLDAYFASREKTFTVLEQVADVSKDGSKSDVEKIVNDNEDINETEKRLAKEYGFKVCSD
jgi:hypothetical protein